MRLFVSIDLDASDELRAAQAPFEALDGIRTVDPERVHFTLKFLGEVDPSRLDAIDAALTDATTGLSPFDARVGGYGAFPSHDYIRVIWVGVRSGGEKMRRLHEAIEARMVELGFDPADHEFTPHATIARMDHAGGKARVQTVLDEQDPDLGSTDVSSVHLTESTLTPEGPEYRTVYTVEL